MRASGRLLLLLGAAGVVLATFLPWVTVEGRPLRLDVLGHHLTGKHVSGDDTAVWPIVVGVGAFIGLLAVVSRLRRLAGLLGLLVALAGGALIYYATNLIDIELSGRSALERAAANAAVSTSAEVGAFVLLGSGVLIMIGAFSGHGGGRRSPATG